MVKRSPQDGGAPLFSTYLSGTAAACGTVSTAIAVPAGATSAWIHAEGAAVYWNAGGTVAGTTSPGYVGENMTGYVPPIDNLTQFAVIGSAADAVAHVEFYQD